MKLGTVCVCDGNNEKWPVFPVKEKGFWLYFSFFQELDDSVALTDSVYIMSDSKKDEKFSLEDWIHKYIERAREDPHRAREDRDWWMCDRRGRCWHFKPISLVEWIPLSGWAVMDFFFFCCGFPEASKQVVSVEFEQRQVNRLVKLIQMATTGQLCRYFKINTPVDMFSWL